MVAVRCRAMGIGPRSGMAVPPLPDSARLTTYSVASTTTGPFDVGFDLYGDSTDFTAWVEVWVDGVEVTTGWTLTSPSGSLATIGRPIVNAEITFTNALVGTVPAPVSLIIVGARRPRRPTQLTEGQAVPAATLNRTFTDITATMREQWDRFERTPALVPGSTAITFPVPEDGKAIGWDGTTLTNVTISVAGSLVKATQTQAEDGTDNTTYMTPLRTAQAGLNAPVIQPQGRLTLTSGVAVTTSDVSGATTLYYTPAVGALVPIYNGSSFVVADIVAELSQATSDTTKSPAAVANNSIYDIFVWNDAGAIRATRGPAWASDTSQGTGAGTSEREQVKGIWVNKFAITNGPAAQRGTLVGSVRSNGAAQLSDTKAVRWVSNIYNMAERELSMEFTFNSYTYTTATYRQINADATIQFDILQSLGGNLAHAFVLTLMSLTTGTAVSAGNVSWDLDAVTAGQDPHALLYTQTFTANGQTFSPAAWWSGPVGMGRHVLIPVEQGGGGVGNTVTWFGTNGGAATTFRCGMHGQIPN